MENLKLTRIDFRLIHGQVMTRWVAKYEIESIVVIDDRSAKSPILKKILLGAAPSGVKVIVWNVAEAAEKWKANEFPKNNLLILFKNTTQAKAAWEAGIHFPAAAKICPTPVSRSQTPHSPSVLFVSEPAFSPVLPAVD